MDKSRYTIEVPLENGDLVLANVLHGTIDLLSGPAIVAWRSARANGEHGTYFEERGHTSNSEKLDAEQMSELKAKYQDFLETVPSCYAVFPTFECNLRCGYCFQHSALKSTPQFMTKEMVHAAFRVMDSFQATYKRKSGPPTLTIMGGEPLLVQCDGGSTVETILSETRDRSWTAEIVSNGTNLSWFLPRLKPYRKSIGTLQISVDGPREINDRRKKFLEVQGSPFDDAISGIRKAVEETFHVLIRLNVDAGNLEYVPEFVELITNAPWYSRDRLSIYIGTVKTYAGRYNKALTPTAIYQKLSTWIRSGEIRGGVSLMGCTTVSNVLNAISTASTLPHFVSYCAANRDLLCFGPDGLVYPCLVATGEQEASVGSYWPNRDLDEKKLQPWRNHTVQTQSQCVSCDVAFACGGGCAYEALKYNGTMKQPHCEPIKELIGIAVAHALNE